MKKNTIGIMMIIILLSINSCSDLNQQIFDAPTPKNAIKTASDLTIAITGLYSNLNAWNGFKEQGFMMFPWADDLSSIFSNTMGTWGKKTTINSGTGTTYNVWNRMYQGIANACAVIDYAESTNLNPDFKAKAISEARFIRGFCYFYMVQYFGGVPIVTKVANYQSDFYPARNTVDEVYKLIFEDFTAAIANLPLRTQQPSSELNRATKGAAQGYLAKAFLTYANYLDLNKKASDAQQYYAKAKTSADELINSSQYQLITDYAKLWNVTLEKSAYNEVIFGIAYTRDASTATVIGEGSNLAGYFNPTTRPSSGGNTATKVGYGALKVHPWFYERYTTGDYVGDYRVEATFLTTWTDVNAKTRVTFPLIPPTGGVTEQQPYINKYVDPGSVTIQSSENDLFLLRYSEIFLIKAEAENELNGPTPDALSAFNKVRERARKANGTVRTTPKDIFASDVPSKEDMRMKIFDERGLEFVGEWNRWFDLVRMRYKDNTRTMYEYQFGTLLPSLTAGLPIYNATTKTWSAGRTEATNIVPFDKKYLLYPIPANEMGVNKNLVQNPGW